MVDAPETMCPDRKFVDARGNGRAPVDAAMLVKPPVFQGDSNPRQPWSHLLEREWKLRARFWRCQLGNLAATTIEQCQSSAGRLL